MPLIDIFRQTNCPF